MGRVCCFSFAIAFSIIALISLTVAIATDYWFEVRNLDDNETMTSSSSEENNVTDDQYYQPFQYPYHVGLWLTCYDDQIPDTVKPENLVREKCVLDYDFESKSIEDFARTSEVCLVISCAIMLISALLGVAGCTCKRKSPLLLSGVLLFLSAITTLVGMCSFIARILMQQNRSNSSFHLPNSIHIGFCWSFYVGWGSLALQLLSGAIYVGGVRGCLVGRNKNSEDNFI